ncbi:MAG: MBL fold metallo-hydrolase [Acidobacteriota bacterium]|nr:MBL fold metallo-hydrolase [Acidobacteriota bacterium]
MADFFELDFLDVESDKSGDAIALRYEIAGNRYVHVVDAGFQATGESVANHIRRYYDNSGYIDHVVATHPDGDHAGGLRTILNEFKVGQLWMLRPWNYAEEIIGRFANLSSVDNLKRRLRDIYPNLAALEEIALEKNIPISEPFQGADIGAFRVLAPTRSRYLDAIVESERTPESIQDAGQSAFTAVGQAIESVAGKALSFLKALWGQEVFSPNATSAENEMSVVQYGILCGERILLTADAGRAALTEAADYAESIGIILPGVDRFQVPHHGSRRNVSTEVLNRWLGEPFAAKPEPEQLKFIAIISSAKKDAHHPRKSVIRAMWHRGAIVATTEGLNVRSAKNAPEREGWGPITPVDYPEDQEE